MDLLDDEKIGDLEYLPCVMNEAMRFEPPGQITILSYFQDQVTIKGINFRKGDTFFIHVY